MGFLDDVKKGASNLGNSINSSVSGQQTAHRVGNLLHDLGALTWAVQHGQAGPDADGERARIEAELTEIAAGGGEIDLSLKTSAAPAPPSPPPSTAPSPDGSSGPPPPPGAATPPPAAVTAPAPPAPAAPPPAAPAPAGGSYTLDDL